MGGAGHLSALFTIVEISIGLSKTLSVAVWVVSFFHT